MSVPTEGFTAGSGWVEPQNPFAGPQNTAAAKAVTMAGVAKVSGVSQGAISSLLNDRDYGIRVSVKTRERVFKICRDLGYIPNDLRAVVRIYPELGEACLLVSDKIPGGIANPFIARLAASLMARLPRQPASLGVILYDEKCDYGTAADLPSPLRHGTASQILCVGEGNETICRVVHERSLPAILIGHASHIAGTTSVLPDYASAARLALGHLVQHGHRHVGIVSGPFGNHDPRFAEMDRAINDAARELGLAIDPYHVFSGNLSFEAGVTAVHQFVARSSAPTALLCLADHAALGVLAAAQHRGIRVPAQLSVITFADHDGAIDSYIPLSAVVLPADELASVAISEAGRQLREGIPADAAKITVDVRLIERDTCGPAKT